MEKQIKERIQWLDTIRGITIISMVLYHWVWDMVYIAGADWPWFQSDFAYMWQQSICWSFILLSGFCWSLGKNKWKHGLVVSAGGLLVSIVTFIFTPGERIVFGVLTFLGAAMLLMIPLEKMLHKVPEKIGFMVSFLFFLFTKGINNGYLGIGEIELIKLPKYLYHQGYIMTFLGWRDDSVFTTDYFSLIPWIFLFMAGYFIYEILKGYKWLDKKKICSKKIIPFHVIGRYSLEIYLLHQPIIYGGVMIGKLFE